MRTFGTYLVVAAAFALLAGCGGGSSSNGGGGFTSPTGRTADSGGALCKNQSCTAQDNYYTCLKSKCGSQAQTCFGSSYSSGQYSGPCAGFIACNMACPCDTSGELCVAGCYTSATADCQTCIATLSACSTGSTCQQATCPTDSGVTPTGANCTALTACCTTLASLSPSAAQSCQTAAAAGVDSNCATALAAIKSAGLCQ